MSSILPTIQQSASLPDLVRRAATSLAGAESAAEILDARMIARFARDGLKREVAMLKARSAHGDVIAAVRRSQGDALEIEALADKRLADEYDAAQERGEVATAGKRSQAERLVDAPPSAAELGLSRKEIHEARQLRDAEKVEPGVVRRILDEKLAAGEEPTKAALRAGIAAVNGKKLTPRATTALKTEEHPEQEFDPLAVRVFTPTPDYGGLPANDRIAELEENIRALEGEYADLMAEVKSYRNIKAMLDRGGPLEVIAAKDEEIRVLKERVYGESGDKTAAAGEIASLKRKRDYWMGEAKRLGWKPPSDRSAGPSDYDDAFYAAITEVEG